MRVLLVEDDSVLRGVLQRVLEAEGHDVVAADTVHAGLTAAGRTRFDVALCDEGLPDGSGRTLLARLCSVHGEDVRPLLMTGDLFHRAQGGFPVLLKPFRFAALIEAIGDGALAGASVS